LASLNALRLVSAGEADAAGTEAQIGVAGASGTLHIDWAGVEGMKFLTRRKGEGEALQIDARVGVREDKLLSGLLGKDFTHDKRLFRYAGNGVLRLLVPFLLLLLSDDYREGEVY
jgi:hypothetical protein